MGSAFHQLCPRYSGTLTPTAPTAIRLWDTFTLYVISELSLLLLIWSTEMKMGEVAEISLCSILAIKKW